MSTTEATNLNRFTRKGTKRSRNGCLTCRLRHVKCDEMKPTCTNCQQVKRVCSWDFRGLRPHEPGMSASGLSHSLASVQTENGQEAQLLDHLLYRIGPSLGLIHDHNFWKAVVVTVHEQRHIMRVMLSIAILYDLPFSQALPSKAGNQYQKAIEWYCQSINTSMQKQPQGQSIEDVCLLLLSSILYLFVEFRQGHFENVCGLAKTAFAIVHTSRSVMWSSKDPTILSILAVLMDVSLTTAINSSQISRIHRQSAILLALKIASDMPESERTLYQLRFELFNIMFDINDVLDTTPQNSDFGETQEAVPADGADLDYRMRNWIRLLTRFEATLSNDFMARVPIWRLRTTFSQHQIAWQCFQPDHDFNQLLLDQRLDDVVLALRRIPPNAARWILDFGVLCSAMRIAWYRRSESVLTLTQELVDRFKPLNNEETLLVESTLRYMRTLITTPKDQATALEMKIFGYKPRSWQRWHSFVILQQIAKHPVIENSEPYRVS